MMSSPASQKLSIFLGGTCGDSTWRKAIVEPIFKLNPSIIPYNPQVPEWKPELVVAEKKAIQSSDLLLFVLTTETRGLASLIEITHYAFAAKNLVLVIHLFEPTKDNKIPSGELLSINEARKTLLSLAHSHKIPTFAEIHLAAEFCSSLSSLPKETWPNHFSQTVQSAPVIPSLGNNAAGYFEIERNKRFSLKVTKSLLAQNYATLNLLPPLRAMETSRGFKRIHVVDLSHRGAISQMMDITEQSLTLSQRRYRGLIATREGSQGRQGSQGKLDDSLSVYFLEGGLGESKGPGQATSEEELRDIFRASSYLREILSSNGDQVQTVSRPPPPHLLSGPTTLFLAASLPLLCFYFLRLYFKRR